MKVPTKLVRCEWPPNPGVSIGDARFNALLQSIKTNGIQDPLTINLSWFVIDGVHRLSAARILEITHVEVRVWTGTEFVQ